MPTPSVLKDAFLSFNAVDISQYIKEINLSYEVEDKDQTTMGANTLLSFPGLKNWRITGKLQQDFAAAALDATMFPLVGDEVAKAVELRPKKTGGVGVNNPKFTGSGYLLKWPPLGASVGEIAMVDFDIGPATDLTRATA